MRPWGGLFVMAILLAGCSSPDELYPLKVGNEWRYKATNQFGTFLQSSKVTRELPVSAGNGYEIVGTLGTSTVAWSGPKLLATVLAGTRYNPAIPLLDGGKKEGKWTWSGHIYAGGKTYPAAAQIEQSEDNWEREIKRKATKTVVTITFPEHEITVETLYVRGIGPVSQTQRLKTKGGADQFDVSLEYLSGP